MKENCSCTDCDCEDIDRCETIYAGVFAVPIGADKYAETTCIGTDPETNRVRSTTEHHLNAVPDLVRMCDGVSEDKGWKYRLLKFTKDGIEELDPAHYRDGGEQFMWSAAMPSTKLH